MTLLNENQQLRNPDRVREQVDPAAHHSGGTESIKQARKPIPDLGCGPVAAGSLKEAKAATASIDDDDSSSSNNGGAGLLKHLETNPVPEEERSAGMRMIGGEQKTMTSSSPIMHQCNRHREKQLQQQQQLNGVSRRFTILNKIGEGGYGNVYTVEKAGESEKDSHFIYALKTIRKDRLKRKPKDIEYAQNERYIMASFTHPFIVHLQYAFQSKSELYYVMEYVPGGEIFTRLNRVGTFSESSAEFYTAEILTALDFLHSHKIIYRDLKPDNILIERDGHIKLADFGLCKILRVQSPACCSSCSDTSPDEYEPDTAVDALGVGGGDCLKNGLHASARNGLISNGRRGGGLGVAGATECNTTRSCCGTLVYMAPEVVDKQAYGRSADFWSLGVVVYDMLVGHPPFHVEKRSRRKKMGGGGGLGGLPGGGLPGGGHHRGQTDRNATRYNILHCNYRLPEGLTDEAKSFIEGLLQLDVNRRLGGFSANADQIKSHPFLVDICWEEILDKRISPPFVPDISGVDDVSHFDTSHTSDVSEVGKVIDASVFDAEPIDGVKVVDDEEDGNVLHINNFEYTSPTVLFDSPS